MKKVYTIIIIVIVVSAGLAVIPLLNLRQCRIREGFHATWDADVIPYFPISIPLESGLSTTVIGENLTHHTVNVSVLALEIVEYHYIVNVTKWGVLGGFMECQGAFNGYWMPWIDIQNTTETASLTITGDLIGIIPNAFPPLDINFYIEGPTTFEVERGGFIYNNEITDVWMYNAIGKNLTIFYDAKTSLMLEATYKFQNLSLFYGYRMLLTESTC